MGVVTPTQDVSFREGGSRRMPSDLSFVSTRDCLVVYSFGCVAVNAVGRSGDSFRRSIVPGKASLQSFSLAICWNPPYFSLLGLSTAFDVQETFLSHVYSISNTVA